MAVGLMFTLLIMGHGRWPYYERCVRSIDDTIGWDFFDRTILSLDGDAGQIPCGPPLDEVYRLKTRQGLTANLTQAWSALNDGEWVFHVEEDFVIEDAPLEDMWAEMILHPQVANMVLVRQPWGAHEIAAGSVLAAQRYELRDRGAFLEHEGGFWLNPSLYEASRVKSLQAGVESSLTAQCLDRGWSFGYWGAAGDAPRCWHIGAEQGMGSPGWLA